MMFEKYENESSVDTIQSEEKKAENLRDVSIQTTTNLKDIAGLINCIRGILGCYPYEYTEFKINNFVEQINANESLSKEIIKSLYEIKQFFAG